MRGLVRFRPELAEALGVFALVLVGCGAILVDATTGALGHVGVSLAFALVIAVMVMAVGHVSGAHLNPAITLGFAATGHFPQRRVVPYVAAQLTGAVAAAGMLRFLFGAGSGLGATTLAAGVDPLRGVVWEVLATFLLGFVIASVATDHRAHGSTAGLAIGLTVGLGALVAGPLTGGSMNPARTLGPALVSGTWTDLWVYLAGPLAGGVLGFLAYEAVRGGDLAVEAVDVAPEAEPEVVEPEVA